MRRVAVFLLSLLLAAATAVPVRADDETPAQRAAAQILTAREAANRATDAYFHAESVIDELDVQAERLAVEVKDLQAQVDDLHEQITDVAINRLVRSGTVGVPLLSGFESPRDQVQIDALIGVADQDSVETLDRYDSARLALDQRSAELRQTRSEAETKRDQLAGLRDAATARVAELKAIEQQRLQDEAVRQALEQKKADEARLAEQNRQRQETATVPQRTLPETADHGEDLPTDTESPVARGDVTTTSAARTTVTTNPPVGEPSSTQPPPITRPAAPSTTKPASGLDPGGQTGGGGAPGAGISAVYGGVGWTCPTGNASVGFGNTWGEPRSGGRRHQGVDMIGERDTPILAVVDGVATARNNSLGGTTISLAGNDGNRYYYAHLGSYGQLGAVAAGTVIGYMGQTGNAIYSVVHLHFEIHPGGGSAVNPYPTVRARC